VEDSVRPTTAITPIRTRVGRYRTWKTERRRDKEDIRRPRLN